MGARVYAALVLLPAGVGVGVASWHVYLQNLPADKVPGCGPGFEYIMENFALFDALSLIFKGSGECADVVWRLLGLSMPTWVIIGLGGLGIAGIWNNLRRKDLIASLQQQRLENALVHGRVSVTSSILTCSSIL